MYVKALIKVTDRYAPSRTISFDVVHIFKTLQLIEQKGHVSRDILSIELGLGQGIIKTLIKHLKMQKMIYTTNSGTKMTEKGKSIFSQLLTSMPVEMIIPRCSVALGKFNYAVLLKQFNFAIKSGIEQRDAAIKIGAKVLRHYCKRCEIHNAFKYDLRSLKERTTDSNIIDRKILSPRRG